MTNLRSYCGEIAMLFEDRHAYRGRVLLVTLDTDVPLELNTFEIVGDVADRLVDVLEEGLRVRIDCRGDVMEVVSPESLETSDKGVAVVLDVVVLDEA